MRRLLVVLVTLVACTDRALDWVDEPTPYVDPGPVQPVIDLGVDAPVDLANTTPVDLATPAPIDFAIAPLPGCAPSGAAGSSGKPGRVVLEHHALGGELFSARFEGAPVAACQEVRQGACVFTSCPPPTPPAALALGTITITGTHAPRSYDPGPDLSYAGTSPGVPYFSPGEMVGVGAAGSGAQPGFSAEVLGPSALSVLVVNGWTIDRSRDYSLPWHADFPTMGYTVVELSSPGSDAHIRCEYPTLQSFGEIPAALLVRMPSGPATLDVHTRCGVHASAGALEVSVEARSLPAQPRTAVTLL